MASRNHYAALDGIRGVAATLVLLGHSSAIMFDNHDSWIPRKGLAVVLFFMISGFVISSSYQFRIVNGTNVLDFMRRRIIRLFPLIFLGSVVGTCVSICFEPGYWAEAKGIQASILAAFCLPSLRLPFATFSRFPINPPEWSLFFEFIAYLLFATWLARVSNAYLLTICVTGLVGFAANEALYETPLFGSQVFAALGAFSTGMLIWRIVEHRRNNVSSLPLWTLAIILSAACLAPTRWGIWPDVFAYVVLFPWILLACAAEGRAGENQAMQMLGDLSYPLYIIHWPILQLAYFTFRPAVGPQIALVSGIAMAVGTAWLILKIYDEPVRNWLVQRYLRRYAGAAEASSAT